MKKNSLIIILFSPFFYIFWFKKRGGYCFDLVVGQTNKKKRQKNFFSAKFSFLFYNRLYTQQTKELPVQSFGIWHRHSLLPLPLLFIYFP